MRTWMLLVCVAAVPALGGESNRAYVEPSPPPVAPAISRPVSEGVGLWKASLVSLAAANALDIHSSWGKRELNNTLATGRGTFGGQSVAVKLALQGGMAGVQYLFLRGRPNRTLNRAFAIMNFGASSAMTGVAVRNYGVPRPPR